MFIYFNCKPDFVLDAILHTTFCITECCSKAIDGAVLNTSPFCAQVVTFINTILVSCTGQIAQPSEFRHLTAPVTLVLIGVRKTWKKIKNRNIIINENKQFVLKFYIITNFFLIHLTF